jgi:adenylate cyclase class 2
MRSSDKHDLKAPRTRKVVSKQKPPQEIEIKLRVADRRSLLTRLSGLGAIYEGRVHEMNTLYDTKSRSMMRKGRLLRIRTERPADKSRSARPAMNRRLGGAVLTFKGPVRGSDSSAARGRRKYKVREEREVRVTDGEQLAAILEAVGLRPSFRYEKYRSTYRLPGVNGVILELDETPIGDFLEAEGNRASIDRAAELLGYGPMDYVTKSYGALFRDSMRKPGHTNSSKRERFPRLGGKDMSFRRKK